MYEKLKSFLSDDMLFMSLLLLLVGIVSFGLGQRSAVLGHFATAKTQLAGVVFTEAAVADLVEDGEGELVVTRPVVVSQSGTKYHLPDCPGAAKIKEENKLYFDSAALAEAAGYTPAANCPGLQ